VIWGTKQNTQPFRREFKLRDSVENNFRRKGRVVRRDATTSKGVHFAGENKEDHVVGFGKRVDAVSMVDWKTRGGDVDLWDEWNEFLIVEGEVSEKRNDGTGARRVGGDEYVGLGQVGVGSMRRERGGFQPFNDLYGEESEECEVPRGGGAKVRRYDFGVRGRGFSSRKAAEMAKETESVRGKRWRRGVGEEGVGVKVPQETNANVGRGRVHTPRVGDGSTRERNVDWGGKVWRDGEANEDAFSDGKPWIAHRGVVKRRVVDLAVGIGDAGRVLTRPVPYSTKGGATIEGGLADWGGVDEASEMSSQFTREVRSGLWSGEDTPGRSVRITSGMAWLTVVPGMLMSQMSFVTVLAPGGCGESNESKGAEPLDFSSRSAPMGLIRKANEDISGFEEDRRGEAFQGFVW
jgi:hypothetical protein